jgi:simple sugar transport system ATP-binding protein
LGENGAGKSTLVGCISGRLQPDDGRIVYEGDAVRFRSPADAARLGIAVVRQHFVLIPRFTVRENVTLGTRIAGRRLTAAEERRRLGDLAEGLGIDIDPDARVETLSVGQQQWVEILKALYLDARLLLLDEPTAVLTPGESDRLFEMIGRMTARGIAVVMISHKFPEVMRADRVTVLRQGRVVATIDPATATREDLARMMVGREFEFPGTRDERRIGIAPLLDVIDLRLPGSAAGAPISFGVRHGEILGIAGVAGNGQDALFETLAGIARPESGMILLDGEAIGGLPPPAIARRGVGYVPSDRYRDALVPAFSVADNLILGRQHDAGISRHGWLDRARIGAEADLAIRRFGIVPASATIAAGRLSGGNAQKLVLARELALARRCLLCHQPTRGLDIGVIDDLHRRILAKRDDGCAVLLASEELDELFLLADRIMVLSRGQIMGIVETGAADRQTIGLMMAGQRLA